MTFAPIDFFGCVIATGFIAFCALDGLAVQDCRTRRGVPTGSITKLFAQIRMQFDPETTENPVSVVGVNNRPGGQLLGEIAPLASSSDDVENPIENFSIGIVA